MTNKLFQVIEWCFSTLFDAAHMNKRIRDIITRIRALAPTVIRCARQCRARDWLLFDGEPSDEVFVMSTLVTAIHALLQNMHVEFVEAGRICIKCNTIPVFHGPPSTWRDGGREIKSGLIRMEEGYVHFLLDQAEKILAPKRTEEWVVSPFDETSLQPPADVASRVFDWARFDDIVHGRLPHSVNVPFQEEVFGGEYTCQDWPLHRSEQHPDGTCDIYYRYPPPSLPHVLEVADRVLGAHAGSALLSAAAWEENPWKRELV